MSDAVKNQLLRSHLRAFGAPTPIGDTRHFWQDVCAEAADTIERLERDRDALAERCERLRAALCEVAIQWDTATMLSCGVCHGRWDFASPERHAPDCLAAPKDGG